MDVSVYRMDKGLLITPRLRSILLMVPFLPSSTIQQMERTMAEVKSGNVASEMAILLRPAAMREI